LTRPQGGNETGVRDIFLDIRGIFLQSLSSYRRLAKFLLEADEDRHEA